MTTPFSMYQVGSEALLPPRDISVSQWADENVVLAGAAAAERGQWQTRPYQREPMDVLSPSHPCKLVVLMAAAQTLKTSILVNFLGCIADVDPGPVLVVEPRSEDAKALSKDRVAPMFRNTPCLRGKLAAVKSRDSNNTALHKVFTNGSGHITFTGAISPSGLAMRPIRYLLLDEVDRYPASAGTEGDPVSLAERRTGEFERSKKVIMCSTPTVDGSSRIQKAWIESDQREYFVPCPMCNHYQVLAFGGVGTGGGLVWPEGEPEKAAYCCENCRQEIPHNQKAWMVERGEYRPQNPGSLIPGFRVSQLVSPKRAWGTIATEFLAAKKSPETLKAFLNTVLAELWAERGTAPDWEKVYLRREHYELGVVPLGGLLLVAGVDVQDDRLEVEIKAYGRGKESWSVDYRIIQLPDQSGQPIKTSAPEVWQELEALLATDWPCASGATMPIMAMVIDSGFRPQMVYDFAARHPQPAHGPAGDAIAAPRTVIPTKGTDNAFKLLASVSSTDAARKRQNIRIWSIGTHWAKQEFYDWLRLDLPTDPEQPFPAGYQHYAYSDDQFYKGLCSETRVVRAASGKIEWVKDPNVRNEPLDTAVLCRAASAVCGIDRFSDEDWAALEGNTPTDATRPSSTDGYWGGRDDRWGTRGVGSGGWFK
jgi:phage terminase large subunit GpA-like protein